MATPHCTGQGRVGVCVCVSLVISIVSSSVFICVLNVPLFPISYSRRNLHHQAKSNQAPEDSSICRSSFQRKPNPLSSPLKS